jgi:hypothetical protein
VYENRQEVGEMVEFGANNNKIAETKFVAEGLGAHLGDHPAHGLLQEVWQHSQTTWKNVIHGKANLAEYAEAGAEVVAGAVACRFGVARLAELAKSTAPEIAETNPFRTPHFGTPPVIKPSEEMLETLSTEAAELRKGKTIVDKALRIGFDKDAIYGDPRIARFVGDVAASNPELLKTASSVLRVMGPNEVSLARVKVVQSMENAGWQLKHISRPDVLTAETILKEGQIPAPFLVRNLRMSPEYYPGRNPLRGLI